MARFVPYGRDIYNKRKAGEKVGLLIVGTGWKAGQLFPNNERVQRCVILDDMPITGGNIMFMAGLDVLVCPSEETTDKRLQEVLAACFEHGKASQVWCVFNEDIAHEVKYFESANAEFDNAVTTGVSVPLDGLAPAIKEAQRMMMIRRQGIYADPDTHDDFVRKLFESAVAS